MGTAYTIDSLRIEGGTIRFHDDSAGRAVKLSAVDAVLEVPEFDGAFTLAASGLANGHAAEVRLTGGVWSAFTEGAVVPVTASLAAGKASLGFEGRAGWSPVVAEGR